MHIQLLSFKYDVCHKEFEPKSAAASWNATSSCLLPSHLATPRGQLHMRIVSFYELLKISLALHMWRPLDTLLELLLNIKGPLDELYPKSIVFLRIVAWHIRVFSRLLNVWGYGAGMLRCYQKRWKNVFLLWIWKLPRIRMWQPTNQKVTCISCMLTWSDSIAYWN